MILAGDRILDRLAAALRHAWHRDFRAARVDVDLESDWRKDRLVHLLERRGKHTENRRAWFGVLAGDDPEQRIALFRGRALVDDDGGFALAQVNRPWPAEDAHEFQPVKL